MIPKSLVEYYCRMEQAFLLPTPLDSEAIAKLSRVVELHHQAAAAIWAAVERSDTGGREYLQDIVREETRLARAVGKLVTELGGSLQCPEESSQELPRDSRAMSHADDQAELIGFVLEDLVCVATAHRELAHSPEIPLAMHQRLDALGGRCTGSFSRSRRSGFVIKMNEPPLESKE